MSPSSRRRTLLLLPLFVAVACASSTTSDPAKPSADALSAATDEDRLSPEELLGRRLFEDTTLSEPRGQSCASCHDASNAFSGNNGSRIAAVAAGAREEVFGDRNVPTAMYLSTAPAFSFELEKDKPADAPPSFAATGGHFWDGRADDLAAQAKGPFLNPREMNNPSARAVVDKVATGSYASLAQQVYGASIFANADAAYDAFARAISAFEHTKRFQPFSSKFDDFLRGKTELTSEEARGFELFKDPQKGNCLACHAGEATSKNPSDWLFTDFTYDNIGVPRNDQIPDNRDPKHFDLGLCKRAGIETVVPKGTAPEDLCGAFKVPTLRNIAKTAPYMHNGYFGDLREVVKFYVTRDTSPERWYPRTANGAIESFNDVPVELKKNVNTDEVPFDRRLGQAPRLSESEIDAVVAFMLTLTDR
jgi:cytochrome c peroxidase